MLIKKKMKNKELKMNKIKYRKRLTNKIKNNKKIKNKEDLVKTDPK